MRPEPVVYGDRKVYPVSAFNRGVASWLQRLPTVWVEGEITELRRQDQWGSVFFTLKDPADGSCLPVSIPRGTFDALRLEIANGASVHVFGRPELYAARGTFRLRALSLEPVGLGALLAEIERRKAKLAAEGLFARTRPLPVFPRRIGLLTGADAAARGDFLTAVHARFPAARIVVFETAVQGPAAPRSIVAGLEALAAEDSVDVVVLARGGGSFEDLLPVQRRGRRPLGGVLPGPGRLGRRTRAGHAALRPRRGRPRLDADRRGPARRPGRARAARAARLSPHDARARGRAHRRSCRRAARGAPRVARPRGTPHGHAGPGAARRRRRAAGTRPRAPRRAQAGPRRGARRTGCGRSRPRRRSAAATRSSAPRAPSCARDRRSSRAGAWTSSSPRAASAQPSRRPGERRAGADVRGGARRAREDRRRARERPGGPRGGARALEPRRGALPPLPREARRRAGRGGGARPAAPTRRRARERPGLRLPDEVRGAPRDRRPAALRSWLLSGGACSRSAPGPGTRSRTTGTRTRSSRSSRTRAWRAGSRRRRSPRPRRSRWSRARRGAALPGRELRRGGQRLRPLQRRRPRPRSLGDQPRPPARAASSSSSSTSEARADGRAGRIASRPSSGRSAGTAT